MLGKRDSISLSSPLSCRVQNNNTSLFLLKTLGKVALAVLRMPAAVNNSKVAQRCRSVNLERIAKQHGQPTSQELCRNDPQLPQGFTPLAQDIAIRPGDTLKATCMFDSSNQTKPVNAGATHNDEMCNLYLMLYSQLPYFMSCYGVSQIERRGTGGVPAEGTLEVPGSTPCCYTLLLFHK